MADKKADKKSTKAAKSGKKAATARKAAPSRPKRAAKAPILTDNRRRMIRISLGVLFSILALYTLVALLSYIFTWTSDQSLAFDSRMFTTEVTAENAGGKIGFLWADLLISKLFGLGALALPIFLGAIAVYCFRLRDVNLLRVFLLCAFGAVIFSVVLAYVFSFTPYEAMLGSGAGGSYGHYASRWLCSMLGKAGAAGVLVLVLFLYACMLTPKVAYWFDDLLYGISHREKPEPESGEGEETDELDEDGEPGLVVEGAEEADTDPTDDWLDAADTDDPEPDDPDETEDSDVTDEVGDEPDDTEVVEEPQPDRQQRGRRAPDHREERE